MRFHRFVDGFLRQQRSLLSNSLPTTKARSVSVNKTDNGSCFVSRHHSLQCPTVIEDLQCCSFTESSFPCLIFDSLWHLCTNLEPRVTPKVGQQSLNWQMQQHNVLHIGHPCCWITLTFGWFDLRLTHRHSGDTLTFGHLQHLAIFTLFMSP